MYVPNSIAVKKNQFSRYTYTKLLGRIARIILAIHNLLKLSLDPESSGESNGPYKSL